MSVYVYESDQGGEISRMTSNGGGWKKESTGSMVWWDLLTVPPPRHHLFMDHLLGSHRAMRTGLFSLSPPVTLRAHGTEPLADAAYDYIVKSKLVLQQSISPGKPRHIILAAIN